MTLLVILGAAYAGGALAVAVYLAGLYGEYAGTFSRSILRESLRWPLTLLERLFP